MWRRVVGCNRSFAALSWSTSRRSFRVTWCHALLSGTLALQPAIALAQTPAQASSAEPQVDVALEQARIKQTIQGLSSPEFSQRRRAFMELWRQGQAALPAVREAANYDDQQIVSAARSLELLLRLEIRPEDNEEIAELLQVTASSFSRTLLSLAHKGQWRLATELVKLHENIAAAYRQGEDYNLPCWLVQAAFEQGDARAAWPVLDQLLPAPSRFWIAAQLKLPIGTPDEQLSVDDRAIRLLCENKPDEAWALSPSVLIKLRIINQTGRWNLLLDEDVRKEFDGDGLDRLEDRARHAAYAYFADDIARSDELLKVVREDIKKRPPAKIEPPKKPLAPRQMQPGNESRDNSGLLYSLISCGDGESAREVLAGEKRDKDNISYYIIQLEYEQVLQAFGLSSDLSNFDDWLATQVPTKLAYDQRSFSPLNTDYRYHCDLAGFLVTIGESDRAMRLYRRLMEQAQSVPIQIRDELWATLATQTRHPQLRLRLISYLDQHTNDLTVEERNRLVMRLYPEWESLADVLWRHAPESLSTKPSLRPRAQDGESNKPFVNPFDKPQAPGDAPASQDKTADTASESNEKKNDAQTKSDSSDSPSTARPTQYRWALMEHLWRFDRELIQEDADVAALEAWLSAAHRDITRMQDNEETQSSQLAKIALRFGLRRQAMTFASSTTNRNALADVATAAMENKDFETAAEWWELATRQDPRQHMWIRQNVHTLRMMGDDQKADELEASIWMRPLALLAAREQASYLGIAREYEEQGEAELARQYCEAALATDDSITAQMVNVTLTLGSILLGMEEFSRQADVMRAGNLTLFLSRYTGRMKASYYFQFVSQEFMARAVSELEKGQVDSALDRIRRFESLRPSGIEICEHTYARLVKAGRKTEADELFERCSQRMLTHLETWPKDAGSHNNLAWMWARCDQRLEDAHAHATLAVELSDRLPTYVDTLAEIEFRRGNVAKAAELARECVTMDPRHAHYRKQLVRFKQALASRSQ